MVSKCYCDTMPATCCAPRDRDIACHSHHVTGCHPSQGSSNEASERVSIIWRATSAGAGAYLAHDLLVVRRVVHLLDRNAGRT